ncbi:MAG: radical SAM protein [Deltaproteobacteria bacterium]|nr:radical SAM protein [Deltaproteobacteria bacterium]
MEPDRQVEIQLGHMCNNRCTFCVSGQRTAMGEALPLAAGPILERIREARSAGHRKITLLGGEPTLQPAFMEVVRECVRLGYEEIVIFTNGVKTARAAVIDEVLATGGKFSWRISLQGATEEEHEATTRKVGSFARILRTLEHLAARGQRISINMCVVGSNHASVDRFPELLAPYGVEQLHLDLMRPADAGERSEEELRAMMPPLRAFAEPLTKMVQAFDEKFEDGFDVNIGNLPYCIAPHLGHVIHHDGETTETIAIDGDDQLSRPWNKYLVKGRDKVKLPSCAECLFESRCSGVFDTYLRFHGPGGLTPVTPPILADADPTRRLLALHLSGVVQSLEDPWSVEERGADELHLTLRGDPEIRVALRRGATAGSFAQFGVLCLELLGPVDGMRTPLDALRRVGAALEAAGYPVVHPVGDDAALPLSASVAQRLRKIRAAAPFGELSFVDVRVRDSGRRADLEFVGPGGEMATVWLEDADGRARGGYRLAEGAPVTGALTSGLRELLGLFRRPAIDRVEPPA